MKFSIGDKIVLKRTDEEGTVTAYLGNDMVEVDVNGTTFPVYLDDIDHPYLKWFTEKKQVKTKPVVPEQLPVEKQKFRKPRLAKGVYLSFIPVFKMEEMEDVVEELKVYLLNELPRDIQYAYEVSFLNQAEFSHEGKLHPFGHVYLHSIQFEDMNDQPRFNWQADDLEDPSMAPARGQLRIRPQKLFQQINQLMANNEPSFSYLLFDEFRPPVLEEIVRPVKKARVQEVPVQPVSYETMLPQYELDLHIENLVESTRGMSNGDIVNIQLSTLQQYLRLAINARQDRMMVVHGLGKGKLRDEVHRVLSETPEVESYANEWHGRYGWGATEVRFKY